MNEKQNKIYKEAREWAVMELKDVINRLTQLVDDLNNGAGFDKVAHITRWQRKVLEGTEQEARETLAEIEAAAD